MEYSGIFLSNDYIQIVIYRLSCLNNISFQYLSEPSSELDCILTVMFPKLLCYYKLLPFVQVIADEFLMCYFFKALEKFRA